MLERLSALILLIVLLPLMILISVAIYIFSGSPILYKHRRCGFHYKEFDVLKFRTMQSNDGPGVTIYNDQRITGIGKFLRKLKLDEIPQLMNIIKGEIVFIGPRPEAAEIVNNHKHYFSYLNTIQPGITYIDSIIFKDENNYSKIYNTEKYIKEILPLKSQLANYTLNNYVFLKKSVILLVSIIAVFHHKFSLRIVSKFFLLYKEEELRIKLNKIFSKNIF